MWDELQFTSSHVMRDNFESVSQATKRQCRGRRQRRFFPSLFEDANIDVLIRLQDRVFAAFDHLCEEWRKRSESHFDSRLKDRI